jgi:hypothetical protein
MFLFAIVWWERRTLILKGLTCQKYDTQLIHTWLHFTTALAWLRRLVAGLSVWQCGTGTCYRRVLFLLLISVHRGFAYSCNIIGGMNDRPVAGRSSETSSHPIDANNVFCHNCNAQQLFPLEGDTSRTRVCVLWASSLVAVCALQPYFGMKV